MPVFLDTGFLERANRLIDEGTAASLRYAALELRLGIEDWVYRKIRFYAKRHGSKLLNSDWRPNKAIKILCQLEPNADRSYKLRIAEEIGELATAGPFKLIGRHESVRSKWVNKNWQKLGSMLHVPADPEKISSPDQQYLKDTLSELERLANGTLISNFATTVSFECNVCNQQIVTCEEALPNLSEVHCINADCNATFVTSKSDEGWQFKLKSALFNCSHCGHEIRILDNEISPRTRVSCENCGTKFGMQGPTWNVYEIK